MKKRSLPDRLCDFFFFAVIGALYAWALSESLLSATVLDIPARQTLFCCAIFVVALNLVFFNKYTALGLLGCLLLAAGWVFFSLYRQDFGAPWFVSLADVAGAFIAFARSAGPYREEFAALAGWGVAFLFSFVTVVNTRLHYGFLPLALLAAGVIVTPIYMNWGKSDSAILVMLFCLLALLARRLYLNTLSAKGTDASLSSHSRYSLILLPVCLLVFGAGWILPKPDAETMGEMGLPDVAGAVDNLMHTLSPDQLLSFTEDAKKLGGPCELNDRLVMIVEAEEQLYLAGAARDSYTGDSWLSTDASRASLTPDENGVYSTDDSPENLRKAHSYFQAYYAWPEREVTVTTGDVRTPTVFSPPFKQTLTFGEDIPLTQDSLGGLRSAKVLPRESSYTQSYIAWDYQSVYFAFVLREFAAAAGFSGLTDRQLAPFLELPDSLPGRVRDLAEELTAGLASDYDKLKALEVYLSRFPYSLDAEALPAGEDFVDHFLFTAKEGYCVHYASAMIVMARSLGIPARYVEGYILPASPEPDGKYWVTNRQAHAWVEAYFDGFGWVRFEPTAPYSPAADGDQAPSGDEVPAPLPVPKPEPEPTPSLPETQPTEDDTASPALPGPDEEREAVPRGFPWAAAAFLLILIGVGFLTFRILTARYRRDRNRLDTLPHREAVLALFSSTLSVAEACGCPIASNETALAYAGRAAAQPLYAEQGVDITRLAGIYSKAAYSSHDITSWERAAALEGRDMLLRRLKSSRRNRPRYWVDRYIRLRY